MAYIKKEWPEYTLQELKSIAKSCSCKEEFREKYRLHYNYCIRLGISKQVLKLIPHKKKWTKETLLENAKLYSKRSDWMKDNISAYNTALKSGYYNECVAHMEKYDFGREKIWSYEKITKIYKKYDNIKDLRINDNAAYNAAIRLGYHDKLGEHLERGWSKMKKWSFDKVAEEAKKYNSISELQRNNPSAYNTAIRNKWLMSVIGHMKGGNTKWTIDKLVDVLSKHPKKEWYKIKECHAAFVYMKRHQLQNKILQEIDKK